MHPEDQLFCLVAASLSLIFSMAAVVISIVALCIK